MQEMQYKFYAPCKFKLEEECSLEPGDSGDRAFSFNPIPVYVCEKPKLS